MATDVGGSAGEDVYGLLRVAGSDVALRLAALREVVPCPPRLAAVPALAPGLVGAMELRRLVVPVLDLAPLVGAEPVPADAGARVVVIVAADGHLVGVLVDEVVGITRLPDADLLALRAAAGAGDPLLVSHWFRHPERGGVVSVLDADRLLALPGVPVVRDRARAQEGPPAPGAGPTGAVPRVTLTVVRAGEQVLALDVAHVHTTLPGCTPEPSVLAGGPCTGVTTFSGREVPVVDPLRVLGLGEPAAGELAAGERGAGLVLDTGTGYVVLAVDALLDLVEVPAQDVLAVPRSAIVRGDLVGALVDLPGLGQALVVDGAALRAEPALRALGSLNTELEGAAPAGLTGTAADRAAAALTGEPHLSYSAGADLLTPVGQVAEILPLPAQVTGTGAHPALRGVVVHRRAAVPVLCLATLLGLAPRADRGEGCLLLVQGDGGPVAFAVEGLRTIVHPTWQDDERPKGPPAVPGEALRCSPLAVVDEPAQLLPVLDLLGLAGLVQAPDEPAPLPREDLVDA